MMLSNKDIDVFVISYNRLTYLKLLLAWLEKAGFEKIHIVDNNSSYPPLLDFLNEPKYSVHRMDRNYGHLVVWRCGKFDDILKNERYIVTDCDVLPIEDCPLDVVGHFDSVLNKFPRKTKVGFGLKIDDIPTNNPSREVIIDWEKQFWEKGIGNNLYDASIDTTFALYRPGIYPSHKKWWDSIRTGYPYVAKHLPWYENLNNQTEEQKYYQEHLINQSSFWSVTEIDLLRKYNKELSEELEDIYQSKKWKVLKTFYRVCGLFILRFREKTKEMRIPQSKAKKISELQKQNKKLVVKIGSIKKSAGWEILKKVEVIFH